MNFPLLQTEQLSFSVGRLLVRSPLSTSPRRSGSQSPCTDSPCTEIDVDDEEEIDVDVEEVGDEDNNNHEGPGSSPARSTTPPSPPAVTRGIHFSSNPPKRFVTINNN